MPLAIKLCGIRTPDIMDEAIRLKADYAGLVFCEPSPRHIDIQDALPLIAQAKGRVKTVAVMVNPEDMLLAALKVAGIDIFQLHGHETPERVAAVKKHFGLPVIKALSVESAADIALAHEFEAHADLLLFDAKTPKQGLPGGNGLSFDWRLLKEAKFSIPWMLSGGLTPENVAEAIRESGASMVDVSSGIEIQRGVKDAQRMNAFVKAARQEK